MFDTNSFADRIFSLKKEDAAAFEALAMEAFRYQSAENDVYGRFIKALGVDAASVDSIHKIPFLPISLFKSMKVVTAVSSRRKCSPQAVRPAWRKAVIM